MSAKRSVFGVSAAAVALVGSLSLGALMFPKAAEAVCLWNCTLTSNSLNDSGSNSPGKYQIRYCFDADCLLTITDSTGNLIFDATNVPTANVTQTLSDPTCVSGTTNVTVDGHVVAFREDSNGFPIADSAAEALFHVVVLGATCTGTGVDSEVSSIVSVNEDPQTVFAAASSITILHTSSQAILAHPLSWGDNGPASCTTNSDGTLKDDCAFPLGVEEWNKQFKIANELPEIFPYKEGEVYFADGSTRFVGLRMCKGDANSTDPSTIRCSAGGVESEAQLPFTGSWAGNSHKYNPVSGLNRFDIITSLFDSIDQSTVKFRADAGPIVNPVRCSTDAAKSAVSCWVNASELSPTPCSGGNMVKVVATGLVEYRNTLVKFGAEDDPVCNY